MIKSFTLWTDEVDDAELAVEQIKSQLHEAGGLLENTIGIVACHYEYIYSGILKAVCDALPFGVVGTISQIQAVPGEADILLLTVLVFTSDDARFVKALTPSLLNEPDRMIAESYRGAAEKEEEKPAVILAFAPFILQNSGDDYVRAISGASGGVPCFGTLAVDDTPDFSKCFMVADGEHYNDRMAMVLVYGDIHPRFYIANISHSKLLARSAVVTRSEGNILIEVNERPVLEYFEDLGLAGASEEQYALSSLPFLLDYGDDTPMVSKLFITLSPEKHAICAGAMPEGSTLQIAMSDKEDVILTTGIALDQMIGDLRGASGALVYSCIARHMTLGAEQFKEVGLVDEKLGGSLPFLMAGSGGEICPTQVSDYKAINRFHNNAFIACLI